MNSDFTNQASSAVKNGMLFFLHFSVSSIELLKNVAVSIFYLPQERSWNDRRRLCDKCVTMGVWLLWYFAPIKFRPHTVMLHIFIGWNHRPIRLLYLVDKHFFVHKTWNVFKLTAQKSTNTFQITTWKVFCDIFADINKTKLCANAINKCLSIFEE